MSVYYVLPIWARGVLSAWITCLVLLSGYACFFSLLQKRYHISLYTAALFLVNYLTLQCCAQVNVCRRNGLPLRGISYYMSRCSWPVILLAACAMTVLCAATLWNMERWTKNNVTESSIKEGMDNLPSGLCWYSEDGTVIMKNKLMESLCFLLTGKYLYDGRRLKDAFCRGMDENHVICLPNDTAWSIYMDTVRNGSEFLYEICAYNITKEYDTTRLLAKKQEEAQRVNAKLTQYSRELAQMITAGEILAAKVRVHDELGQGLLLTRKYLLRGGSEEDREKLLYVLRKNSTLMEGDRSEGGRSYLEMILEAASDMGVTLVIDGMMPENRAVSDVITTAIHENLTNTIRHAQGDEMLVKLTNGRSACTAEFTNNGAVPQGPVEERGGLAMLRALVEAAGGEMEIEHTPKYKMTLRFEGEE